jgi:membrane associated rhomboid family serine protease
VVFLPYKAQIKLTKIPVVTILISLLCIAVYIEQYRNEQAIYTQAETFCAGEGGGGLQLALDHYLAKGHEVPCEFLLLGVYTRPRPQEVIDELAREIAAPYDQIFRERYREFEISAPPYLTAKLWQERPSWHVGHMLTATIAHADWRHLIFNLIFFFIFAATLELLIGPVLLFLVCLVMAIGIGSVDTLLHLGRPDVTVTLGLSGVVMGVLGLFAYFIPHVKIRFFYWFLIFFGTVGIPAWVVTLWYIGWDFYYQLNQAGGTTNLVAHLVGACLGFAIGIAVFRKKRKWARDLVIEDPVTVKTSSS